MSKLAAERIERQGRPAPLRRFWPEGYGNPNGPDGVLSGEIE
ncbi:hypothetical protein [uncultured Hymenobacter sp.]